MIIAKKADKYYEAFVLSSDEDIEEFFNAFGISSTETNGILPKTNKQTAEERLLILFQQFIEKLVIDFPTTIELATGARNIFFEAFGLRKDIVLQRPDIELLNWIATEFDLFKATKSPNMECKTKQNPMKIQGASRGGAL